MWNRYGTDMEQIFSIHLFRSEPLNFQGFLPVFDGDGTDGTDVNILSSYIRKKYIRYVYISKLPFYLYHLFQNLENP